MQVWKKAFSLLLAFALLLSCCPAITLTASAADVEGELIATITFGADGSASHADGNSIGASKSYTENGYTLALTNCANIYAPARDAKGHSCLKFGASSKAGSLTFAVAEDVAYVVVRLAKYKSNTSKCTINGTAYTLTKNSNDGAYDEIEVDTTATKSVTIQTVSGGYRMMMDSVSFYKAASTEEPEETEPVVTEPVETEPVETEPVETEAPAVPTVATAAEAVAGAEGALFTVTGVVTFVDGKNIYIQDSTGAISVFQTAAAEIALGDTVTATGSKTAYNGLPQLGEATVVKGTGMSLSAKETTLSALTTADLCTYVTISDLTVKSISSNSVTLADEAGKQMDLYKPVLGEITLTVGDVLDFTGAVSCYNTSIQLRNTSADEIVITYEAPEPEVEKYDFECDFSKVTAGTQYAVNEEHVLSEDVTLYATQCHVTTQLRIYSSSTHNGYVIIKSAKVIKGLKVNAGNKVDTLNVYGSTDGSTWTLIQGIKVTSTSYNDYTLEIPESAGYTFLKLDVAGSEQIRIASMAMKLAEPMPTATVVLTPSKTEVKRGESFDVTVSITQAELYKSMGFDLSMTESPFTVTDAAVLEGVVGAQLQDCDTTHGGAFSLSTAQALTGNMFRFTLTVNEDAAFGAAVFTGTASANNDTQPLKVTLINAEVTIVCAHETLVDFESVDNETHKYTCDDCGETFTATHGYDDEGFCESCGWYKQYTIVYKNWDGTVLAELTGIYYDWLEYEGEDPVKPADETYTYAFRGWTPEVDIVTGDAEYTAVFEPVYIDYTVTFKDHDGTVLATGTYHYGDTVTAPAPADWHDEKQVYTFSGWDAEIATVTGNAEYTACYEVNGLRGDFTGDGKISDRDALYLLRYNLFGEETYPLNQSGDTNGDGNVTDADVVYLLRHVLFPHRYTLY